MIKVPPINKHPTGLLGFLGIKNGGRYPQALTEVLTATLDLRDWYFSANEVAPRVEPQDINVVGYQAYYTVPDSEFWVINQATAFNFGTLIASQKLRLSIASTKPGGNTVVISPSPVQADEGRLTVGLSRRIFVSPGETVGILANEIQGGPISIGLALRYTRLLA